jgi:hypothetical protein
MYRERADARLVATAAPPRMASRVALAPAAIAAIGAWLAGDIAGRPDPSGVYPQVSRKLMAILDDLSSCVPPERIPAIESRRAWLRNAVADPDSLRVDQVLTAISSDSARPPATRRAGRCGRLTRRIRR